MSTLDLQHHVRLFCYLAGVCYHDNAFSKGMGALFQNCCDFFGSISIQVPGRFVCQNNRSIGGQQQRVAIARALASDAPVILADEPTGNLDADTAEEITAILKESAHAFGKCVVVVTHSGEVAKQADVVLEIKRGHLKEREMQ